MRGERAPKKVIFWSYFKKKPKNAFFENWVGIGSYCLGWLKKIVKNITFSLSYNLDVVLCISFSGIQAKWDN